MLAACVPNLEKAPRVVCAVCGRRAPPPAPAAPSRGPVCVSVPSFRLSSRPLASRLASDSGRVVQTAVGHVPCGAWGIGAWGGVDGGSYRGGTLEHGTMFKDHRDNP